MSKPTVLYASPFPPQQSGIAGYSAALVPELSRYFDITLYTGDYELANKELRQFKVLRHGVDRVNPRRFDRCIYHIGNNPWYHGYIYEASLQYPDTVFLHEPVIYYLVAGLYQDRPDFYARLYNIGGPGVVSAVKQAVRAGIPVMQLPNPQRFPLNRELLHSKNRFVVHSDYAKAQVEKDGPADIQVERANLADVTPYAPQDSGARIRRLLKIPSDGIIVSSFGYIAPTKQNREVCQAVARVNERIGTPMYYVMVGPGDYADAYLSSHVIKTGWIDADYADYVYASDLVMNLRYPIMGETSAAVLRAMRAAKPCVVTDIGWFAELPGDTVIKLPVDRPELIVEYICEALLLFRENREAFLKLGQAASNYATREHDVRHVADRIAALF